MPIILPNGEIYEPPPPSPWVAYKAALFAADRKRAVAVKEEDELEEEK